MNIHRPHLREILGFSFSPEKGTWWAYLREGSRDIDIEGTIEGSGPKAILVFGEFEFDSPQDLIEHLCTDPYNL